MQSGKQTPDKSSIPPRQDSLCTIRNFDFASGERLPTLTLAYSTLGTPEYDSNGQICNAVLLLHSSTSSRLHWLKDQLGPPLFGDGQVLDATRYFIILPDLIGHGDSSKPSDGLRADFPRYRCQDMVKALHLMVTQGLKIQKLHTVIGTSLGAMVTWLWGQMYPESITKLVPIGAYPLPLAGRNWIIRRMGIDAIRYDPGWQNGQYTQAPTHYLHVAPLLILLAHGVKQLHTLGPSRQAADRYYETLVKHMSQHDANDLLYVLEAAQDFDPSPSLETITAQVLAINFEGDELCRPELAETDPLLERLPNAQFVLIPANAQGSGHFTYYQADTWKACLAEFLGE
ncbi:alpha/beta fold hydrolase [Vreelandella venusta]|uniref:alpha/beta fold hydrolase n=1 Tax=Vreelandella venusta TaxID=44935 RepID=UPI00384D1448